MAARVRILIEFVVFFGFFISTICGKCVCVSPEQCERNYGAGLLDVRIFHGTSCTNQSQVCCNTSDDTDPESTAEQSSNPCGYQNLWFGSLLYKNPSNDHQIHKCGVTLIHNKAVLTAAHCLIENGTYSIRIGNIIRSISRIITHPDFKTTTLHNDIALLLLSTPIPLSRRIGNVCLPQQSISLFDTTQSCQTAIWNCEDLLRTTKLGKQFQLHQSFMCALSADDYDTCTGDGGSPLVCSLGHTERFYHIGIVSWGIGCGNFHLPGVYTNVAYFQNWITKEMLDNGFDIKFL